MTHRSTKSYGPETGLSACFRQWRAESHCRLLHGYALSFKFIFEADKLDENNWVLDFGSLKPLKEGLIAHFDHKLVVAEDDPMMEGLLALHAADLVDIVVAKNVGCEMFAFIGYQMAEAYLFGHQHEAVHSRGLRVVSVECAEHGANSAIYIPNYP